MERIVLITGGNKGLGFETAKVLQQKGYNVYIGSRDKLQMNSVSSTSNLMLQMIFPFNKHIFKFKIEKDT